MKKMLLVCAGAGALACGAGGVAAAEPAPVLPTAVVTAVVDGDTVQVTDAARGTVTVRILGIDTPETKKPGHTVGCWGPEATAFATHTLLNQPVALVADPTQDTVDAYGRTLAYVVKPDGWNYSVEAARAGVAKSYVFDRTPVQQYPAIVAAEDQARTSGTGLWGPPCHGNTDSVPLIPAPAPVPAPAPAPTPPPAPAPQTAPFPPAEPDVYYKNCSQARAAGVAPLYRGDPGYAAHLDRDNDGIACE
ncbi:thermonuclease family protein [Rhodococcus sp. PSBB049]|uniref:thermonuclease family protein n=1 Tax=Rhodococcus sp. PSBB049 TaxID=2812863 RepID=UPI00197D7047|nr:thermonuclease family protein [Rhodococcus sp. PSBB049]QSE72501.1 thermonuclease family protein [Rhodococcus sp. PSBB049]